MAQWLRSIQGQLTEFATEVLNEATSENADDGEQRREIDTQMDDDPTAQQKIVSLEKHIKELQEQLTELNSDMETIEIRHSTSLRIKEEEVDQLKNQMELSLQLVRQKKDNEMRDLEKRLEDRFFAIVGSKDEEIGRLNEELEELRSMLVQDSNQNFEMLPGRDEEIAERNRQIEGLRRQVEELANQSSGSSVKVESVENLSERAEELMEKDREIGELRRQIDEMNLFVNQSRQEIESVETLSNKTEELIEKDREIEELRNQIDAMNAAFQEAQHEKRPEFSNLEQELIEKDQTLHALRNQIEVMRLELNETRDELENNAHRLDELIAKEREIQELRLENEKLSLQINNYQQQNQEQDTQNEAVIDKDRQIGELNKQIEEMTLKSTKQLTEDHANVLMIQQLEEELETVRESYEEDKRRAIATSQELQKRLNEAMEGSSNLKEMTMKKMGEIGEENERLREYITQLETKGLEINDERAKFLETKMMETEEKCVFLMNECKKKDHEIERISNYCRQTEEKISESGNLEEKMKHLETSLANFTEEKQFLLNESQRKDAEIQKLSEYCANVQQEASNEVINEEKIKLFENKIASLEEENRGFVEKCNGKDTEIQQLSILCNNFQENLSKETVDNEKLASLEEKYAQMEKEQRGTVEEYRKREREIERLKAHLLQIEETSTKEAIEAQNREETLKEYIVFLENTRSSYSQSFEETNQHYQVEMDHLKARLKSVEAENTHLNARYEEENRIRVETQNSLTSLQSVVRELASDAEKDNAASGHERLRLQDTLDKRHQQVAELQRDFERVSLDKQALEENIDVLNNLLLSNRRMVEELELQVAQARVPKNREETKIDDAILRELFLSYFMAAPDRKNDIALLLAKILEYSQEDYETIQKSLNAKSVYPSQKQASINIVEQFVRYLETESESSRTAPQLPLPKESRPMDTQQLSPKSDLRSSDSATTLQNLLRQ
ncbi:unnamed protein product, partial [Mesorhabditis belari]|uniref:GRIP domain-containing protein n=1 Tax=Mesorhabditis belari TaxID=2138241 RepID=A0AAF3EAM8_9BILA